MFGLIYGLYEMFTRRTQYYVVVVGLDGAGKTTLLQKVLHIYNDVKPLPPSKVAPTVGLNLGHVDVRRSRVTCWDLGGQADLRTLWDKYYAEAHGVVFVVDAADPDRFDEARATLAETLADPALDGVPLLFLLNKKDLPEALELHRDPSLLERLGATAAEEERDVFVHQVSGLDGEGVEDALDDFVAYLEENAREIEAVD